MEVGCMSPECLLTLPHGKGYLPALWKRDTTTLPISQSWKQYIISRPSLKQQMICQKLRSMVCLVKSPFLTLEIPLFLRQRSNNLSLHRFPVKATTMVARADIKGDTKSLVDMIRPSCLNFRAGSI